MSSTANMPEGTDGEWAALSQRRPNELGMMYASGRVVGRDLVAAHMWFNIAAMNGDRESAVRRQELAGEMSREEVSQALAWARAWMDANAPVER
jgi:TPR repeat protein